MKRFFNLGLLLICGVALVACGSKENANTQKSNTNQSSVSTELSSKSSDASISSSSEVKTTNNKPESIDLVAKGEYIVGEDIQPGKYYLVLDTIEYSSDDSENNGYINFDQYRIEGDEKKLITGESFISKVGDKFRINLKEGDILEISDNYSPDWIVKLLNDNDFKTYQKK